MMAEAAGVEEDAGLREQRELFGDSDDKEFFSFEVGNDTSSELEFSDEESDGSGQESEQEDLHAVSFTHNLSAVHVEEFTEPHGPTEATPEATTAKDFFNLYFDNDCLEELARNSEVYAPSKGEENFTTSRAEVSAYIGMCILMGIQKLPSLEMYWSIDPFVGNAGIKKTIPKWRFKEMLKYFHITKPEDEDAKDKLSKVRPFITQLQAKLMELYVVGKNVSIDEGLVKFTGRLGIKQKKQGRKNVVPEERWQKPRLLRYTTTT